MENQQNINLHNNADLIYEYTKERIKDINDGINRKINALAGTLAFCGATLKFTNDIPVNGYYFSARVLICFFLLIAMGSCVAGLQRMKTDNIFGPKDLLKPEIYRATGEECKITIIQNLIDFIPSLQKVSKRRGDCLMVAFRSLTAAIVVICITIAASQT